LFPCVIFFRAPSRLLRNANGQYLSIRYPERHPEHLAEHLAERLAEADIEPSGGSVGRWGRLK
jgi:hypothetical protein